VSRGNKWFVGIGLVILTYDAIYLTVNRPHGMWATTPTATLFLAFMVGASHGRATKKAGSMSPDQTSLTLTRSCRECGADIPWDGGPGRPRVLCDACRPDEWPLLRGRRINQSVSGESVTPTARRSDPESSHDAARKASVSADNNRGLALLALVDHGPMTDFELADVIVWRATEAGIERARELRG
jgi:hypothetical protein